MQTVHRKFLSERWMFSWSSLSDLLDIKDWLIWWFLRIKLNLPVKKLSMANRTLVPSFFQVAVSNMSDHIWLGFEVLATGIFRNKMMGILKEFMELTRYHRHVVSIDYAYWSCENGALKLLRSWIRKFYSENFSVSSEQSCARPDSSWGS